MYSPSEYLRIIAENDFLLLLDTTTPDDVWVVTPERKRVQVLATANRNQSTLRIPKAVLDDLIEASLVCRTAVEVAGSAIFKLTAEGKKRGLSR